MKLLTRSISAAVLTIAWHSGIPVANAQVEGPSPGVSTPSREIPDQKLDAAAAALQRVALLQQAYRQQLAEATAQSDKERIVAEANDALAKAVVDQGLSVDEYASILETAKNDAGLREKILQRIRPPQQEPNSSGQGPGR